MATIIYHWRMVAGKKIEKGKRKKKAWLAGHYVNALGAMVAQH